MNECSIVLRSTVIAVKEIYWTSDHLCVSFEYNDYLMLREFESKPLLYGRSILT